MNNGKNAVGPEKGFAEFRTKPRRSLSAEQDCLKPKPVQAPTREGFTNKVSKFKRQ